MKLCRLKSLTVFLIRAFVPAVLLGEAEPKSNEQSSKTQDQPAVSSLPYFFFGISYIWSCTRSTLSYLLLFISIFNSR